MDSLFFPIAVLMLNQVLLALSSHVTHVTRTVDVRVVLNFSSYLSKLTNDTISQNVQIF